MSQAQTTPLDTPGAVQTATRVESRLCPVCEKVPLRGDQRVACSDACRARRWRERRDQELLAVLDQAAAAIQAARQRYEKSP